MQGGPWTAASMLERVIPESSLCVFLRSTRSENATNLNIHAGET